MPFVERFILPIVLASLLSPARAATPHFDAPGATASSSNAEQQRAWLGVFLGDALDGGVHLVAVAPGGPAAAAGLLPGDIILQLGERSVPDRDAVDQVMSAFRPGQQIRIRFVRGGHLEDRVVETASGAPAWRRTLPAPFAGDSPDVGRPGENNFGIHSIAIPEELRVAWGAPRGAGVLVGKVDGAGSAAKAGLKTGDVLVRINGMKVSDPAGVALSMTNGSNILEIVRNGSNTPIRIVLGPAVHRTVRAAAESENDLNLDSQVRQLELEVERLRVEVRRLKDELARARGGE